MTKVYRVVVEANFWCVCVSAPTLPEQGSPPRTSEERDDLWRVCPEVDGGKSGGVGRAVKDM